MPLFSVAIVEYLFSGVNSSSRARCCGNEPCPEPMNRVPRPTEVAIPLSVGSATMLLLMPLSQGSGPPSALPEDNEVGGCATGDRRCICQGKRGGTLGQSLAGIQGK